jgi:UDP-glucose:(heptosyl)LPS alpha-1,3-glucosyltransferase
MKIAYLVHEYNRYNGHSRYVYELVSRYKKHHEIHVFATVWEEDNPEGINFHYVPAWRWKTLTSVLTSIIPSTLQVSKEFDIIHAQGLCGFRQDVITAHLVQTAWLREFYKYNGSKGIGWIIWRYVVAPLERLVFQKVMSKEVIAISEKVKCEIEKEYGRRDSVTVIYHGVDLDKFNPSNKEIYRKIIRENLGIDQNEFLAIFAGNIKKGGASAIKAVARLNNCRLLILSGSDISEEKDLAIKLGIFDKTIWLPLKKDIEKYYAASDCLLFPTFYDTFGMVISEAMATGIPVITTPCAGASELLRNGYDGFLVDDPKDISQLSQTLDEVIKNPTLGLEIGKNARKKIEDYNWDKCASETMNVYNKIIQKNK